MDFLNTEPTPQPRLVSLKVENFRALRSVEFKNLTPLTALLGPNGSGKSTVFDALAFLADSFQFGLGDAWEKRGGGQEIQTRGESGPVVIQVKYRERPVWPLLTYHLAVEDITGRPAVKSEWLRWRPRARGRAFYLLDYRFGEGSAYSYDRPEAIEREKVRLQSPDLLAVNALGQIAQYPRIAALRKFVTSWHISRISAESAREQSVARSERHLTKTGNNLASVVQYLKENSPEQLEAIISRLRRGVPQVEGARAAAMPNGWLILQVKDAPFDRPIPADFASDGTLKMLAYLALLYDPEPPPFISIEEPENFLHHRLLYELVESFRAAAEQTQLLVTTHSPYFVDALRTEEVRILWRDKQGFTQTARVADVPGVPEFMEHGAQLGQLWSEGHFRAGDPLYNREADPRPPGRSR